MPDPGSCCRQGGGTRSSRVGIIGSTTVANVGVTVRYLRIQRISGTDYMNPCSLEAYRPRSSVGWRDRVPRERSGTSRRGSRRHAGGYCRERHL